MFSNIFKDKDSSQHPTSGPKKEASLETILPTPELRAELALVVVLCTDAIRNDLSATFQVPAALQTAASFHDPAAEENLIALDENQRAHASRAAERAERVDKIKKELAADDVQDLYRAALSFFNNWRVQVLKRLGETLKVHGREIAILKQQRERSLAKKQELDLLSLDDSQTPPDSPHSRKPIPTTLTQLPEESRTLILNSILLLLLSLQNYPAHSRLLLLQLSSSLRVPTATLCEQETALAKALLTSARQLSAEEETARAASSNATSRKWKVGLATVAGAALIGVTGGLAAPFLAAGVGTVLGGVGLGATAVGGLLGGLAGSSVLVGGLFGAYGGRMTGKMMDKYTAEVSDFRFIAVRGGDDGGVYERQRKAQGLSRRDSRRPEDILGSWKPPGRSNTSSSSAIDPASEHHRLRVAITISGWLTDSTEVFTPWFVMGPQLETFALRWEVEALLKLGTSLSAVLKSAAWSYAKYEIVKRTVLGSLAAGLWPLMLLRVGRIVDNPFSIAKKRSEKAGAVLADALINKAQGERPVTLIGYSLGARVIYSCLLQLAERRAFGLIENVVMMGAPTPSDAAAWRKMRTVVAGRLVNVYSSNDHILGFLYRTSSIQLGVAGLQKIEGVEGVENFDASAMVDGHTRYRWLTGTILKKIGMEELDDEEVRKEEEELRIEEAKERKAEQENEKMVEQKIEKAGDSQEERRIIMQDVAEEEAKLLEMRTGVRADEPTTVNQRGAEAGKAPPFEKLSLQEEPSPQLPLRPSQNRSIPRKPVGQPANAPESEMPPEKPPRPSQPRAGPSEKEDAPPPQPPRRTTAVTDFAPAPAIPVASETNKDILVDDYDDDNLSIGEDDVESVGEVGEMTMLEAEPISDSEPETESRPGRK
ncbi:uncharacterized protein LTHEOB_12610 [Lasiodiplodia theobromae]|uniref:Putative membrane protein n=1 Tax=Lasiodiplodia theobromae TaxID=45133 RepID=A0A5N5CXF9_9PEZI|nr:uncharacterized protein LTHEOB_12610 [Lasiodiplodia theobromae]KAB2570048.1 putative membrane protein [Lasiodiplodia theobromae]KAF4535734.1 hypothetical protein LTHEOB_12610 [Lasiodiplodia theobromae]